MTASASALVGKLTAGARAIVVAYLFAVKKAEELEAEDLCLKEK